MKRREHSTAAAEDRRGRFTGLLLAGVILLAGLAVVVSVYTVIRAAQHENAERVMDQRTEMARAAAQTETERYRTLVETAAAGMSTDPTLTWETFDTATAPLASANLIGAASVTYIVAATESQLPALQSLWRSRGAEGLRLRPATAGPEHYFTIFTRPLNGVAQPLNGLDAAGATEAAAALQDSRRIGQPSVSDTYVLLRDRELPAARQQRSFIFAAPIRPRAGSPEFRGWLVLGLRGGDFLKGMLATVSQGQLDGELLASDRESELSVVAQYTVAGRTDLQRSVDFIVADRKWTLITRAEAAHLPGASSTLPLTMLLTGSAMTVLLAGLVYVLATGRARAQGRVQVATAELRTAEENSRRQAELLGAIMASISDAVGVVDERGAFLLHNPAARALLGVIADDDDPAEWQKHYGLYKPDGRTPFPVEETPLIRALHGESCDGVEMVIRNAQRPEGVLVSVDGRPLDTSADRHGAVAVFHDITELRRYENDLAVFAGVVAHDLKAPLTVIRGHCEAASEDLEDGEPDGARHSLGRITLAVDRMAGLIDTLLAYSTARDAPLRTGPVDLDSLVAETVHDRTAHLRPGDTPEITVGPLSPVTADPAMLRHVLDNLIGNALKYVHPGSAARVEVSGSTADGWTRVEVADRGIGIPDEAKDSVFESFHRAHAEAGYAGTGLGLAICKRIVERHGGEIGVTDNPGGGTRFHFTLPSVPAFPKERTDMKDTDEDATRAALERALAERAAMENTRLPGLSALPAADPSAHDPAAARLRAPVPDHHPRHD